MLVIILEYSAYLTINQVQFYASDNFRIYSAYITINQVQFYASDNFRIKCFLSYN